jgi:hypothetical protein
MKISFKSGERGDTVDSFCKNAHEIFTLLNLRWSRGAGKRKEVPSVEKIKEQIERLIVYTSKSRKKVSTISTGNLSVTSSREGNERVCYLAIEIETWFYL